MSEFEKRRFLAEERQTWRSPTAMMNLAGVFEDTYGPIRVLGEGKISVQRKYELYFRDPGTHAWARFAASLRRRTGQRVGRDIFHLWCVDSAHCVECGEPFERYVDAAYAAGENGVLSGYRVQR